MAPVIVAHLFLHVDSLNSEWEVRGYQNDMLMIRVELVFKYLLVLSKNTCYEITDLQVG